MLALLRQELVLRGAAEILLLAVLAATLGTWIVMRGLAFWAHAVGTAAFPGLVLADGLGLPGVAGGVGAAALMGVAIAEISRRRPMATDSATALVLVGAVATGVVLASDVFGSTARVDGILFGSLLAIRPTDLAVASAAAALALLANRTFGARWLATGLEPATARAGGIASGWATAALTTLVGLAVASALAAAGALLAPALLVVPAATARLVTDRVRPWQVATAVLAVIEGLAGLFLSLVADMPPGATIAAIGGCTFLCVSVVRQGARPLVLGALGVIVVMTTAFAPVPADTHDTIVVSTTQLGDVVGVIAGRDLRVHVILPPGADPHAYEPRPRDALAIAEARLVLASGRGIDDWLGHLATSMPPIDVSHLLPARRLNDPHWWGDPTNVAVVARGVAEMLARLDPAHAVGYRSRAQEYVSQLAALDAAIRRCVATVPPARRVLVSDHDAFGYLADRYGITVAGAVFPSQSEEGATSVRALVDLVQVVRRTGVHAVFAEASLSHRVISQIAAATGVRADLALYGDSLGRPGSGASTYLTMEAENATRIVLGMTGQTERCEP